MIPAGHFQEAVHRVRGQVERTPLSHDSPYDIWIKWENQQRTGSFKARGAFNKVLSLRAAELERGLVCASAGNHGQAVALAAQGLAEVEVFVADNAAQVKVQKMRALGARIHEVKGGYGEAESAGRAYAGSSRKTWISAYNDPTVIAGQATVTNEILDQLGDQAPEIWLVPVGGGGLIAGVGGVLNGHDRRPVLIGVQPAENAFMHALMRRGTQDGVVDRPSLADGLTGAVEADSMTISMARDYVDDWILVSEEQIGRAVAYAWIVHHQVIEGSGAAALAAALYGAFAGRPRLALITGGNIDPALHAELVSRHAVEVGA